MNLLNKFFASLKGLLADERKQAKEGSFFQLAIAYERLLKRRLTTAELIIVYSLDDDQTEVLHKMISEANKG